MPIEFLEKLYSAPKRFTKTFFSPHHIVNTALMVILLYISRPQQAGHQGIKTSCVCGLVAHRAAQRGKQMPN